MAATTTLMSPATSRGDGDQWVRNDDYEQAGAAYTQRNHRAQYPHNNDDEDESHYGPQMGSRRKHSRESNVVTRWDDLTDSSAMSPTSENGFRADDSTAADRAGLDQRDVDENRRAPSQGPGIDPETEANKWIHRDKLAKIESEELQAAGIFLPKQRAQSKNGRDRSRSRVRRGTDATESRARSRKNSLSAEQRLHDASPPAWDLRTPEEIAADDGHAYFSVNGHAAGSSRIPVAKTSPAPIPYDYLERAAPAARKPSESPDNETILYPNSRSRSTSGSLKDIEFGQQGGTFTAPKRAATEASTKKKTATNRKASAPLSGAANTRPKTRSRSGQRDGARPVTRSGDLSNMKRPEGDPPWMINSYKPDPRLPPDQQLLPTVARRLQQEKWEKEGKFGDTYDKDFRPLNDNVFLRPPEAEKPRVEDPEQQQEQQQQSDEWPLRRDIVKSPSLRHSSYSTMPKITDKSAVSPLPSPRTPNPPQQYQQQDEPQPQQQQQEKPPQTKPEQPPQRLPEPPAESEQKDGGCGCCVVM